MEKQQLLAEIRAKVIAAVPEIVELRVGSFVLIGGVKRRMITEVHRGGVINVERYKITPFESHEYEIIGRPITLSDVLMSLNSKEVCLYYSIRWSAGNAFFVRADGEMGKFEAEWNLAKTLEDQDLPALQFLYKILVGDFSR